MNRIITISCLLMVYLLSATALWSANTLQLPFTGITSTDDYALSGTAGTISVAQDGGAIKFVGKKTSMIGSNSAATVVLRWDKAPDVLTITAGATGHSGATIKVSTSPDGASWSSVLGTIGNAAFDQSYPLASDVRFVRLVWSNTNTTSYSTSVMVQVSDRPIAISKKSDSFISPIGVPTSGSSALEYNTDLADIAVLSDHPDLTCYIEPVSTSGSKTQAILHYTYLPTSSCSGAVAALRVSGATYWAVLPINLTAWLAAPTAQTSDITTTSFRATWSAVSGADSYLFRLLTASGEPIRDVELDNSTTTLLIDDLYTNTGYGYQVLAVQNAVLSQGVVATQQLQTLEGFSLPAGFTTTVKQMDRSGILLEWSALEQAARYLLTITQAGTAVEGYFRRNMGVERSHRTLGLLNERTYTYHIEVIDANERISEPVGGQVVYRTDYGQQLTNGGFENWENLGTNAVEPIQWNSFMSASADGLYAGAKSKKVDISADVRAGSMGRSSAHIWSNDVMSVKANANLTTGRIYAGDISPTSTANRNQTVRSNSQFSHPMTVVPDSVSVWVKFKPKSSSDQARIALQIHGDRDFRDPNNDAANASFLVATAEYNYHTTNDQWVRLSVPFVKDGAHEDPRYILASFTSNKTPGQGSVGDLVWIDDIVMIYKPTLGVSTLTEQRYAQGTVLTIPFEITGSMSPSNLDVDPNMVYIELSDSEGSFTNATVLDELRTNISGQFRLTLPHDIAPDGHRIRIRTTNYPMVKELFAFVIAVATEDSNMGVVSGGGNYNMDADVRLSATAHTGYHFENWTDSHGRIVSTDPSYSFKAQSNQELTAHFTVNTYQISVQSQHEDKGSVAASVAPNQDGSYNHGVVVEFTAAALEPYTFVGWQEDGEIIQSAASLTITATEPRTIVALFEMMTAIENIGNDSFNLYPNPTTEYLYIEPAAAASQVKIYNLEGSLVSVSPVKQGRIEVRHLEQGAYLLVLQRAEGYSKRIFIKK